MIITLCTVILLAAGGLARPSRRLRDVSTCSDPPVEQLLGRLNSNLDLHPTFIQHPQLRGTVQTLEKFRENHDNMVHIDIAAMDDTGLSCSAAYNASVAMNLVGDPCPVNYVYNYDANRVPHTLVEANCSCSTCVGLQATPTSSPTSTPNILGCKPVHFYIKVLRKQGCPDGVALYVEVWEPVTVGCACRHPRPVNGTQQNTLGSTNPQQNTLGSTNPQ